MVELADPVEEGGERGLIGDVQQDAFGRATELLHRQVDPAPVAGGDDHVRTLGRCGLGDGEADAGGAAYDDDTLGVCRVGVCCVVHGEDATFAEQDSGWPKVLILCLIVSTSAR